VAAAPAATQRSCWRSTPREARNRRTRQTRAAARLPTCRSPPRPARAPATAPAGPSRASGLAIGVETSGPGSTTATMDRTPPARLAATAQRQRGERSRPSGSSSSGRVTPRAMAGAHSGSPAAALTWANGGSGRPVATRLLTQASPGTFSDQSRPEPASSQPIGLPGRRRVRTSPSTAKPRYSTAARAPSASTARVSGRTRARATTSPAARQAAVAANNAQASTVLVRGCRVTGRVLGGRSVDAGSRVAVGRYGNVTVPARWARSHTMRP
jgi:hypothetical protein